MTSLDELKKKLELAKSKVRNEETQDQVNNTIEITDGSLWLMKINEDGNKPCEWLRYTRFIKENKSFSDALKRHNVLCGLYDKAFKAIDIDENKKDLSLALLFIDYADVKRTYRDDEAQLLLTHARARVRRFAIVHVAAAELEIALGDRKKASKILEKAKLFDVQPEHVIEKAIHKIKAGEDVLISPDDREKCMGYSPDEEMTLPVLGSTKSPNDDTTGDIIKFPCKNEIHTDMNESHTAPTIDYKSKEPADSISSIDTRPKLHKFHSYPDFRIDQQPPSVPRWRRGGALFGKPMRVKKMTLPFTKQSETSDDEEEIHEEDTMDSFKPLNNSVLNNDAFEVHDHTSGYLSMSQISDITTPFEKKNFVFKQSFSDNMVCQNKMETDGFDDHLKHRPEISVLDPIHEDGNVHSECSAAPTGLDEHNAKCDNSDVQQISNHCAPSVKFKNVFSKSDNIGSVLSNNTALTEQKSPPSMEFESLGNTLEPKLSNRNTGSCITKTEDRNNVQKQCHEQHVVNNNHCVNKTTDKASQPYSSDVNMKDVKKSEPDVRKSALSSVPHSLNMNSAMCTPSMKMNPALFAQMQFGIPCTPNMLPGNIITINGHNYTKLKVIGRGGTCTVHSMLDQSNNLRAVKIVELDDADESMIDGYRNEIDLLQRLQYCDKVIKMYDFEFSEADSCLYVVMEIGDTDLASLFRNNIKKGEKLDELTIKFYWSKMLEAVSALHKEGIVHSDLKPANFLLVAGNLKLIDFGIAKAIQHDRTSVTRDTQSGTLNYMSPEAIIDVHGGSSVDGMGQPQRKYKLGTKSDTWSLGCILYTMVHGRTPFQNIKYQMDKLQAIVNPNYPINFPDHHDTYLCDVLKKCLIRDPKQRPSIDDLLKHSYLKAVAKKESPETQKPAAAATPSAISKQLEKLFARYYSQYSPRTLATRSKELLNELDKGKENVPLNI